MRRLGAREERFAGDAAGPRAVATHPVLFDDRDRVAERGCEFCRGETR